MMLSARSTHGVSSSVRTRRLFFVAAVAFLLAYLLRIYNLGVKDIWWDEAHSWWYAAMPLFEGVRRGMSEWTGAVGDPFYPIMLSLWMRFVGQTPFALRYLSLLLNLLSIAYLAKLTNRAFGLKPARIALLLGSISPIWIFYAQEVRQYTLTPLVMLVAVEAVVAIIKGKNTRWSWVRLVIGEVLALYTHSFMAFGIVGLNLWLALIWLRRQQNQQTFFIRWVISQVAALVLIAPALPNYIARTRAGGTAFIQLNPVYTVNAIWNIFMGIPWEHATDPIPVRIFAALVLILMLVGLAVGARHMAHRRTALDMLYLVIAVSLIALAYWWFTPIIHPRYLLFLTGPLFAVLSVLLVEMWQAGGWQRFLCIGLVVSLVLTSVFNLSNLYTGRYFGYRHDPVGEVTTIAADQFTSKDGVISIDPFDYAIQYYGVGQAELFPAGFDEGIHADADLVSYLQNRSKIGVIRFHAERSDLRRVIPFYLERYGSLISTQMFESYELTTYQLTDPNPQLADFTPQNTGFGDIQLTGYSVESGDAVTVALLWEANQIPGSNYSAVVRLIDPQTDWLLAEAGASIYDNSRHLTSEWQTNTTTEQYFVLPLVPGTPSIETHVIVTLVNTESGQAVDVLDSAGNPAGQQVNVAQVTLGPAPGEWRYGSRTPVQLTPVDSGIISAYTLQSSTVSPGSDLPITIQWRIPPDQVTQTASIQIWQGDTLVGQSDGAPLQGREPANAPEWLDRRLIAIDPDAQNGHARLVVQLGDEDSIELADVTIEGFARITQRPDIETEVNATFSGDYTLLGYTLEIPEPLTSSDTLTLVLFWQLTQQSDSQADYTVFTQVLSEEGQLVAQHDSPPAFGIRPTSSWQPGEYIIDEHPISFREVYAGEGTIQVGLYNPETFERLITDTNQDAVQLPITLTISP